MFGVKQVVVPFGIGLMLLGCGKDPAKLLEAKAMAVCACTSYKCAKEAERDFAERAKSFGNAQISAENSERARNASVKYETCLKKLAERKAPRQPL